MPRSTSTDVAPYRADILHRQSWITYTAPTPPPYTISSLYDAPLGDSMTGIDYTGVSTLNADSHFEQMRLLNGGSTSKTIINYMRSAWTGTIAFLLGAVAVQVLISALFAGELVPAIIAIVALVGITVGYFKIRGSHPWAPITIIDNPYMSRFSIWVHSCARGAHDPLWAMYSNAASLSMRGYKEVNTRHNRGDFPYQVRDADIVYSRAIEFLSRYAYAYEAYRRGEQVKLPKLPSAKELQRGSRGSAAHEAQTIATEIELNAKTWIQAL